ncbi:MAG: NADH-quinone oxidoreductase subunit K [Pseudomonadota bacterium]
METLLAPLAGLMAAAGVWLMLSGHMLRVVFGIALLGSAANLVVFVGGRLTEGAAPLIAPGAALPDAATANPLPQALVLTAIVIGFGFAAFALSLAVAAHRRLGTVDTEAMQVAEAAPAAPRQHTAAPAAGPAVEPPAAPPPGREAAA